MTAFRVTIGERAYEGHYSSPTNAVFGAMRKDENCHRPTPPPGWWQTDEGKQQWHEEDRVRRSLLFAPLAIFVEEVKGRKVAKEVHKA